MHILSRLPFFFICCFILLAGDANAKDRIPVAYSAAQITAYTNSNKPFRVATEQEWIEHNLQLAEYREKTGKTHQELMGEGDAHYMNMVARTLVVRQRFADTAQHINTRREAMRSEFNRRLDAFNKGYAEHQKSIKGTWDNLSSFHQRMENDWLPFKMGTLTEYISWEAEDPWSWKKKDCAKQILSYVKVRDYLLHAKDIYDLDMVNAHLSDMLFTIRETMPFELKHWLHRDISQDTIDYCVGVFNRIADDAERVCKLTEKRIDSLKPDHTKNPVVKEFMSSNP